MNTRNILLTVLACTVPLGLAQAGVQIHPAQKVQKVTITVDHGFKPASVTVKSGLPLELTFDVKHRDCASSVVFKDLKLTTKLTDGKKSVVKFTPKSKGAIKYACSMNMLKGQILAK